MVQQSRIEDLSNSKWAIMVCLDGKDDWIFVTENTGSCDMFDLRPLLFDDINVALEHAKTWTVPSKEHNVKVVNYGEAV